jgi:hypothetical protein
MIKQKGLIGIAVAAALLSGNAYAGTVTNPLLGGSVIISDGSTTTWNLPNNTYTTNPDGTFTYANSLNNRTWGFTWDITVDPDPLISGSLAITNNTSVTKHFDFLFTLPVGSPFASPALKSGSLGASFQDLNNSGAATLSNINWSGRIDGSDAMSLFSGGFTCLGAGCNGSIGTVSDGPLSSSGVNTNIGMHLAFDLTAGDKATFNTSFEVTPVPLPAAFWLLGSGVLGLVAVARRRVEARRLV